MHGAKSIAPTMTKSADAENSVLPVSGALLKMRETMRGRFAELLITAQLTETGISLMKKRTE